jgi:hypothetical protein
MAAADEAAALKAAVNTFALEEKRADARVDLHPRRRLPPGVDRAADGAEPENHGAPTKVPVNKVARAALVVECHCDPRRPR